MARRPEQTLQNAEAISPTVGARDNFIQPTGVARGQNELQQVGAALGRFSPTLHRQAAQRAEELAEQADADAQKRLNGMTFEEADKAVRSGQIEAEDSPYFRAAFLKLFGRRAATQAGTSIQEQIANGQLNPTDDEAMDNAMADAADSGVGASQSKHYQSGFSSAFAGVTNALRQSASSEKLAEYRAENMNVVVAGAYDAVSSDTTPEGRFAALNTYFDGVRKTQHMSAEDTSGMILSVARTLAANGETELLQKMLSEKQPNGAPAIALQPKFAASAQEVLRQGERAEARLLAEANEGVWIEANTFENDANTSFATYDQWLQEKHEAGIMDDKEVAAARNRKTARLNQGITDHGKAIRDVAIDGWKAKLAAQDDILLQQRGGFISEGDTAQEFAGGTKHAKTVKVSRKARVEGALSRAWESGGKEDLPGFMQTLGFHAETFPLFTRTFEGGLSNAQEGVLSLDKDPAALDVTKGGYQLYKDMGAQSQSLREAHLGTTESDFYALVEAGEERGETLEGAIAGAVKAIANPETSSRLSTNSKIEIGQKVKAAGSAILGDDAINGGDAQGWVTSQAVSLMARGMPQDQAVDKALETFEAKWANVDGQWMKTAGAHGSFEDFSQTASTALDNYATGNADAMAALGYERGDLHLQLIEDGSKVFVITGPFGEAVPNAQGQIMTLPVHRLKALEQGRLVAEDAQAATERDAVIQETIKKSAERKELRDTGDVFGVQDRLDEQDTAKRAARAEARRTLSNPDPGVVDPGSAF